MKSLKIINIAHVFGIVWLLSILIFVGAIVLGIKDGKVIAEQYSTALVFAVITGLIAFLGAFILYMTHFLFLRKKTHSKGFGNVIHGVNPTFLVLLLLFLGFIGIIAVKGAYNLGQADKLRETGKYTDTKAPVATETVRYTDSDPVITCTSSYPQCSGQSIKVKQSACSQIYCCGIGDKWSVYPSENDCKVAQNAAAPTQQQNNLVSCYVYGQTFNLTPEKCSYYQSEEAGANKALNSDTYTPPTQYQNTQTSTPIPTTAPEKYHSTQEACRKNCYETYKNYPDTSLAKQQCVNSCN